MLNREYYMINNDTRRVYDTYKEAQAKAAGYRIDKLVMADKWVVPFGEWYDAKLLAVTEYDKDGSFVVEGCFNHREGVKTYMSCRMRASERKVK